MSPPLKKHKVDKADILDKIDVLQNDVNQVKDILLRMQYEETTFRKLVLDTITNQHNVINNSLAESNVSLKTIIQSFWKTPKYAKLFPISTDEDLQKWEDDINENNKDEMAKTVTTIIGEKGLRKGLPLIIAKNLLLNYNVDGVHNKTSFKSFRKIYEVLFLSYTSTSINSKEPKSFDSEIRLAFKQAKNRHFKGECVKNKQGKLENLPKTYEFERFMSKEGKKRHHKDNGVKHKQQNSEKSASNGNQPTTSKEKSETES